MYSSAREARQRSRGRVVRPSCSHASLRGRQLRLRHHSAHSRTLRREIQWTDGMLYPVLHSLEANGSIRGRWEKAESGRRRRYYAVLPKARKSLEEHRTQWTVVHSIMNKVWRPKYA